MCSVDLCGDVARREGYPYGLARPRGGLEPATPSEVLWESRTLSWPAAFEGSHGAATAWVECAAAARVWNCRSRRSMSRHVRGGARVLACARPSRGSSSCLVAFPRTHELRLAGHPHADGVEADARADIAYEVSEGIPNRLLSDIVAASIQIQVGKRGWGAMCIPLPFTGGSTSYLDDKLRVTRGNRGGLFVHVRPELDK